METGIYLDEGNMGQSEDFNWLGILKVYLDDGDGVQVAVTGIVLVKPKYAIASADDVVRIPRSVFQTETQAMFIASGDVVVHFRPTDYITHPEYELATYNTVVLVQLDIGDDSPLIPICFPAAAYDSNYLYFIGYTDENRIVEKVIYRIEYINKPDCEEFYAREGLRDVTREPTSYVCGVWRNASENCVWDTGMALVSNNSGWFTLIGLSIHGPGCAAPARFINIPNYIGWIHDVTREKNEDDDFDDSRQGLRNDWELDNIPIHKTFSARKALPTVWPLTGIPKHEFKPWPFDTTALDHFNVEPHWEDEGVIAIFPFNLTKEMFMHACKRSRVLMYREYLELSAPGFSGSVTYKVSMYDLLIVACSCVTIEVECVNRSEALLAFREEFIFTGDTDGGDGDSQFSASHPDVFRYYPITERSQKLNRSGTTLASNANLKPSMLNMDKGPAKGRVLNYDLYIKITFNRQAKLKVKLFGEPRQYTQQRMHRYRPAARRQFQENKKSRHRKPETSYWGLSQNLFDKTVKGVTLEAENADVVEEAEVVLLTASKGNRVKPAHVLLFYVMLTSILLSSSCPCMIAEHWSLR
uniref:Peptidase S1 domain-containing protein n=1 Tax=Heliothis virescens TaxID=7102 RepID=A0A2A4J7X2_HELVI